MAKVKTIMPGVVMRSGDRVKSVRYSCMIRRQRFAKTAELPFALLVDEKTGKPTRYLKDDYAKWVAECDAKAPCAFGSASRLRTPTIRELIEAWEKMAWKRNADKDYRKPKERTIVTAVRNYKDCVEVSGLDENRPYYELTDVDTIRKLFNRFRERGCEGISAKSYVMSLQTVTSKWSLIEYRDLGYEVKSTLMPDFGRVVKAKPYKRLSPEQVAKINRWYATIMSNAPCAVKLCVCLIYNLAIRPKDCGLITRENFPADGKHHRLKYTPSKTDESSGREVDIEIPDALYEQIRELAGERWNGTDTLVASARNSFAAINTSMRIACGMPSSEWNKAAYELRKLCLDTVMQQQGIEQAIKLSGDRRDTLEHYYVDPYKGTQPLILVAPQVRRRRHATIKKTRVRENRRGIETER